MPEPHLFGAWTASVVETADAVFTDTEQKKGRIAAVLGGHGDLEVQAHRKPDGVVFLKSLAISGFLTIRVPRVWDDSERRVAERDPRDELGRLARRFKTATALDEWSEERVRACDLDPVLAATTRSEARRALVRRSGRRR